MTGKPHLRSVYMSDGSISSGIIYLPRTKFPLWGGKISFITTPDGIVNESGYKYLPPIEVYINGKLSQHEANPHPKTEVIKK